MKSRCCLFTCICTCKHIQCLNNTSVLFTLWSIVTFWYTFVTLSLRSQYTQLQLFYNLLQFLLSPSQLTDPSITVTDRSPPPSAPHIPVHSLTTSHFLSAHNSPQPGRKLSCRPRYISMLSITATLSISNHNLLFFLLLAPSCHHPAVSDCPAEV